MKKGREFCSSKTFQSFMRGKFAKRDIVSFSEEDKKKVMSKGFKCPECGGKLVEGIILASCSSPEEGEFPMHYSTCSECKSDIPDHIGFRWNKMTVSQSKKEWEEFKYDWEL